MHAASRTSLAFGVPLLATLLLVLGLSGEAASPAAAAARPVTAVSLTGYVNPFIGTDPAPSAVSYGPGYNTGDVFPGAVAPHGMLAWSPDTTSNMPGGYWYPDNTIKGFSLDHFSGRGCSYEGDIPFMPVPAPVTQSPVASPATFQSTFSHANETASPGYYQVGLDSGVGVQLAATTRTGIGEFTYPAGAADSSMIINTGGSVNGDSAATVTIDPSTDTVTGSATTTVGCGSDSYAVYFAAHFDHAFTTYGTWQGATLHSGSTTASGSQSGAYLSFDTSNGQPVLAKTALSYVSVANAGLNLATEDPGWSLPAVQQQSDTAWNAALAAITVTGGTADELSSFYTALYHFFIEPGVFSDVNGQYTGFDNQVHTVASGHTQYDNITTWDGYRSFIPLLALLSPPVASDVIQSLVTDSQQAGPGLPRWEQADRNSAGMVGDSPDPYIASAYAFGARSFDTATALHAMDLGASTPGTTSGGHLVRENDQQWLSMHYDPGQAATSLEYATDDFSVAQFAKALGQTALYHAYMPRAQNWQYVFNPASGFAQPKDSSGAFAGGFNPASGTGFVEGDAYQYTPMVAFNVAALAAAEGGRRAYTAYLDHLFTQLNSGPNGTGSFQGNEPSEEIAWQYDYTGAPWKTQATVRNIQTQLYTNTPGGLPGNDDAGAMSSWYIWSALGMYPETPGVPVLALDSPLFPSTQIALAGGHTLTINAPQAAPGAPYVQQLLVNGKAWHRAYLPLTSVSGGGTLAYTLGTTASTTWAAGATAAAPSYSAGQAPAIGYTLPTGQAAVPPGGTATVTVAARNVTATSRAVTWTASAASGVTVSPASGTLSVPPDGDGTEKVQVTAGPTDGNYAVTFHLTAAGGTHLPDVVLNVVVARPGDLAPYADNVGISDDTNQGAGNFDSNGYSYSEQALTAAGLAPGASATSGGVSYTWPGAAAGQPDDVIAAAQTVDMPADPSATKLGILGSATNAESSGCTGTVTVTYTDGTAQQLAAVLSDWTLGGGKFQPAAGNVIAAQMSYRNSSSGTSQQGHNTYVFAETLSLTPGKTVASITLPSAPNCGSFHVFAVGLG